MKNEFSNNYVEFIGYNRLMSFKNLTLS